MRVASDPGLSEQVHMKTFLWIASQQRNLHSVCVLVRMRIKDAPRSPEVEKLHFEPFLQGVDFISIRKYYKERQTLKTIQTLTRVCSLLSPDLCTSEPCPEYNRNSHLPEAG